MMLVFLMIGTCFYYEKKAKISPAPVLPWVRRKALALIPESFDRSKKYKIADLGSGWGGLLLKLSKQFPNSDVVGYEISPWPFYISKMTTGLLSRRVTVKKENFFQKDISEFDIVVCYLSPYHMKELKSQFASLKPGSVIVSCSFPVEGWEPDIKGSISGIFVTIPIFVYSIK